MARAFCASCRGRLSVANPHSKCDRCLMAENGVICAPSSTCTECEHLTVNDWKVFLGARKRSVRDERFRALKKSQDSDSSHFSASEADRQDALCPPPTSDVQRASTQPSQCASTQERASTQETSQASQRASTQDTSQASQRASTQKASLASQRSAKGSASSSQEKTSSQALKAARNYLLLEAKRTLKTSKTLSSTGPDAQASQEASQALQASHASQDRPSVARLHPSQGSEASQGMDAWDDAGLPSHTSPLCEELECQSPLRLVIRKDLASSQPQQIDSSDHERDREVREVSQRSSGVRSTVSVVNQSSPHDYISDLGDDESISGYRSPEASPIRRKLTKKHKKHKKHRKSSTRSPDSKSEDIRTPHKTTPPARSPVVSPVKRASSQAPSPSHWASFTNYLQQHGLFITPAASFPPASLPAASPAEFGEEELGPSPPKIARRQVPAQPSLKRKTPSSARSSVVPDLVVQPPSTPAPAPESPPGRREVTFAVRDQALDLSSSEEEPEGIRKLSQLYHPKVRLGLIAQTLNLPSPKKVSSGFTSSLEDDIRVPNLVLPHSHIVSNMAPALDKSMSEAPAFNIASSLGKPKLPDTAMEPLPFPERAHELDASLDLLGSDLKRYTIHDEHLAQLDSSIRKSLRHTSMMEQLVRTINSLSEGTEELDHVSIRSLGESLMFSLAAVADASAWLLGSICHMRRQGILSKRVRGWSEADCSRLVRLPWSSKCIFGDSISQIAKECAQDKSNVWSMQQVSRNPSPPSTYATPKFRFKKRWDRYVNPAKGSSFRSPGKQGGRGGSTPHKQSSRQSKGAPSPRGGRGGKKGGKR